MNNQYFTTICNFVINKAKLIVLSALLIAAYGAIADDVDKLDDDGKSMLYKAVEACPRLYFSKDETKKQACLTEVKKWLDAGADPNLPFRGATYDSPMGMVVTWQYMPEVFDLLVKHGGEIHARSYHGKTAIYYLIKKGGNDAIVKLLAFGVSPDQVICCDEDGGQTPLNTVIARSKDIKDVLKIAETLLESGANPNYRYRDITPLVRAATKQNEALVVLLLRYGADVNLDSPLHSAIIFYNEKIIDLLIEAGADINMKNNAATPRTPLWLARKNNKTELIEKLINLGAID